MRSGLSWATYPRLRSRVGPLPACRVGGRGQGRGNGAGRRRGAGGGAERARSCGAARGCGGRGAGCACGLPRELCWRVISISLPRARRLGGSPGPPSPLGGARRRGTLGAGFRGWAGDPGGAETRAGRGTRSPKSRLWAAAWVRPAAERRRRARASSPRGPRSAGRKARGRAGGARSLPEPAGPRVARRGCAVWPLFPGHPRPGRPTLDSSSWSASPATSAPPERTRAQWARMKRRQLRGPQLPRRHGQERTKRSWEWGGGEVAVTAEKGADGGVWERDSGPTQYSRRPGREDPQHAHRWKGLERTLGSTSCSSG